MKRSRKSFESTRRTADGSWQRVYWVVFEFFSLFGIATDYGERKESNHDGTKKRRPTTGREPIGSTTALLRLVVGPPG